MRRSTVAKSSKTNDDLCGAGRRECRKRNDNARDAPRTQEDAGRIGVDLPRRLPRLPRRVGRQLDAHPLPGDAARALPRSSDCCAGDRRMSSQATLLEIAFADDDPVAGQDVKRAADWGAARGWLE